MVRLICYCYSSVLKKQNRNNVLKYQTFYFNAFMTHKYVKNTKI